MYRLVILFGLVAIGFAEDGLSTTTVSSSTSKFSQDFYRNQRFRNPNNPYNTYNGNKFYQPNTYKYTEPNYFDKDYQKTTTVNYYDKDYTNKNYYNNEYYQKYNQDGKSAGILRSVNDIQPDGSYQYGFETQNGIAAEQQGVVKSIGDQTPVVVQGFYRYISPEGIPVEVKYTADELGYHPQASVISGQGKAITYKSAVTPAAKEE